MWQIAQRKLQIVQSFKMLATSVFLWTILLYDTFEYNSISQLWVGEPRACSIGRLFIQLILNIKNSRCSPLGPLLFSIYTSPISTIAQSQHVSQQQYADDTQLYLALSPANHSQSICALQSCLNSLHISIFGSVKMAWPSIQINQLLFCSVHHSSSNLCPGLNLSMWLVQSSHCQTKSRSSVPHWMPTLLWRLILRLC